LQNDIRERWWRIAINPDRFDKLITALRTAVDNDGTLYMSKFDEEADKIERYADIIVCLSYFLVQLTYALSQW
jgi:hypothetical protein